VVSHWKIFRFLKVTQNDWKSRAEHEFLILSLKLEDFFSSMENQKIQTKWFSLNKNSFEKSGLFEFWNF
jgi:hypothetical protein